MGNRSGRTARSDALVLFGVTGDLAHMMIFPALGRTNYLRFRLSPSSAVALAARVKCAGQEFVGDQRELFLLEEQPGEDAPYERLLTDAMAGDGALFVREEAIEAAWAVVDPVLKTHRRACPYRRGSWGPKEARAPIARDGTWHNALPMRKGVRS
jgi:glucose-6-phosphate 1-dehydrogenase